MAIRAIERVRDICVRLGPMGWDGLFEAHGLAIILGVLLIRAAASPGRGGHGLAAAVHVLLGGANLLFWDDAFVRMGLVPVGAATTALHLLFLVAQGVCAVRGWAADASDPRSGRGGRPGWLGRRRAQ